MKNQKELYRSMRFALLAGFAAAAFAAPVFAQEDADAQESDEAETLDEVIVTGTRISSPNAVSSSPVLSVGREDIDRQQPVAVEDIIKTLPGAVPAIGPGTNNGSGGGATIDLRGLGSNRTLVLLDGRRIVPFDLTGTVDTNSIPLAMIERIDLVTGGASAVYGADAIAGVINFITKRNFEGITGSFSYGTSDQGDADRKRADITIGGNFAATLSSASARPKPTNCVRMPVRSAWSRARRPPAIRRVPAPPFRCSCSVKTHWPVRSAPMVPSAARCSPSTSPRTICSRPR